MKHEEHYISFIARNILSVSFIVLNIKELGHDPLHKFIFDSSIPIKIGNLEYCLSSINTEGIRKYSILKSGGIDSEDAYSKNKLIIEFEIDYRKNLKIYKKVFKRYGSLFN